MPRDIIILECTEARAEGKQVRAAALLGISRYALHRRMRHLGLSASGESGESDATGATDAGD